MLFLLEINVNYGTFVLLELLSVAPSVMNITDGNELFECWSAQNNREFLPVENVH